MSERSPETASEAELRCAMEALGTDADAERRDNPPVPGATITAALRRSRGNITRAAELLGFSSLAMFRARVKAEGLWPEGVARVRGPGSAAVEARRFSQAILEARGQIEIAAHDLRMTCAAMRDRLEDHPLLWPPELPPPPRDEAARALRRMGGRVAAAARDMGVESAELAAALLRDPWLAEVAADAAAPVRLRAGEPQAGDDDVTEALRASGGNIRGAGRLLGVDGEAVRRKLARRPGLWPEGMRRSGDGVGRREAVGRDESWRGGHMGPRDASRPTRKTNPPKRNQRRSSPIEPPAFLASGAAAWAWARTHADLSDIDGEDGEAFEAEYRDRAEAYAARCVAICAAGEAKVYRMIAVARGMAWRDAVNLRCLGKAWSAERRGAGVQGVVPHARGSTRNLLLVGVVAARDIDWEYGFTSFLSYGESQWEISLEARTRVRLVEIDGERLDTPVGGNTGTAGEIWAHTCE